MWMMVAVAVTVLLAPPAVAQTILDAEPTIRVDSGEGATSRHVLRGVERAKHRVIIIKRGERYLWASHGGRDLVRRTSGPFHYFIDPLGEGYIKVVDSHALADSRRGPEPRYSIIEHMGTLMYTVTYWGATDEFLPEADQ